MTNKLPADSQMTDVFGRFQSALPPAGEISGPTISNRKKAMLSAAAVLLGGGAVFAAINFDKIRDYAEGNDAAASLDGVPSGGEVPAGAAPATTTVRHHAASAVQNGTITPNENIGIASQVEEQMPFGQAYATAREEVGACGIFSWHGQVYNTLTVEEWQDLSLAQRQDFLSDVGYQPTQDTESTGIELSPIVETNGGEIAVTGGNGSTEGTATVGGETGGQVVDDEPDYIELVINGRPALGIDDDHDGIANAIVFLDENSDSILAFVDAEGDAMIDTVIQFDATSQQVVGQQAIEEPFVAEMSHLEDLSELGYEEPGNTTALVANDEGTLAYEDDNDYTDDNGYVNDAELPEMD